ncbi:MAG TPA: response regulator, partial [Polyangiaceae bacterium]
VLIVEDEVALLHVLRRLLESAGYRVLTSGNGDEALRVSAAYAQEIHALITDVVMPGMNGSLLARSMLASRPGIKVLFISGYPEDSILHEGVLKAGTWFLSKPFTADTLRARLREVLEWCQDVNAAGAQQAHSGR